MAILAMPLKIYFYERIFSFGCGDAIVDFLLCREIAGFLHKCPSNTLTTDGYGVLLLGYRTNVVQISVLLCGCFFP